MRMATTALGDLRRVPDAYHLFCILWREGSRRTVNKYGGKEKFKLTLGTRAQGNFDKKRQVED